MADESSKIRKSREDRAAILAQANAVASDLIGRSYPVMRGFGMCDQNYRATVTLELVFDFDGGEVRGTSSVAPPVMSDASKRKIPVTADQ